MTNIVTSGEFVAAILSELALQDTKKITLSDTLVDKRFEDAYQDLLCRADEFDLEPNFTIATNAYHGDSSTLRETIYALRDRGVVAINNPSFKTVEFVLSEDRALKLLERSTLPRTLIAEIVQHNFGDEGDKVDVGERSRELAVS